MTVNDMDKMSLHELLEYIGETEDKLKKESTVRWVCFNHPLERYLYEYWNDCTADSYRICSEPLNHALKLTGEKYLSAEQPEQAENAYEEACLYAPADIDGAFGLAAAFRSQGKWQKMRDSVKKAYDYIFSKADIAQYYRYMGCYELEIYHPDIALALYRYSNLFSHSDTADEEIRFLKEAGADMAEMTAEGLCEMVKKGNIPLQPDPASIGLAYKVGKMSISNGEEYGITLMRCVYELTGDREAGELCGYNVK